MKRLILIGAVMLAAGTAQAAKPQIVFPQGSEQPLAALQDIDVIEHLGDRVPGSLAFTDGANNPVRIQSLLGRGKPVLVTLGYHRCPMLCGLVLDGLVKAARVSGLKLGKDFLAVDVSIDPAEDAKLLAATQKRVLMLSGSENPADWPFWSSVADGGAAARALADAVGFRYKFDPDQQAVRARRRRVRADVRRGRRPLPVRRRLPGARLPHGGGRGERRTRRHLVRQGADVLLPL